MKLAAQLATRGAVIIQEEFKHETKDAVKAKRLSAVVSKAKAAMQTQNLVVVVFKLPAAA
jgi:hypothetical protein